MLTMTHAQSLLACKKSCSVGLYGEQIAANALERVGYHVTTPQAGDKRGDLVAIHPVTGEVITVEVKTSRRGAAGYAWQLWKRDKHGSTSHRYSDVVMLLAALKTGRCVPFVIPTEDIRDLHSIKIRTHPQDYAGKYARYRQHMHALTLEVQL